MKPKVFIHGGRVRDGSVLLDGHNSLFRLKAERATHKLPKTLPGT